MIEMPSPSLIFCHSSSHDPESEFVSFPLAETLKEIPEKNLANKQCGQKTRDE